MRSDLEWLDKWRVPPFLEAEPDHAALEELKALVLRLFGHLLKGWRCAFDTKDSNCVSWTEFATACRKLKFTNNVPGVWAALDADMSGMVTMKEYDQASYDLLKSF